MGDSRTESFNQKVGAAFLLGATGVSVELTEVKETASGARSVLYRGPSDPILEQATYSFQADDESTELIFIVPLGPDESGAMIYEAVFTSPTPT